MEKERYYLNTRANDDEAYRRAISYACGLAENDHEIKTVILLAITKNNVGWLERLYGDSVVKKLFSGTKFEDCRPVFKIETLNTYRDKHSPSEVVITLALDDKDLFKVDDYYSIKAIIVVPWTIEGVTKWIQTWDPTEITGTPAAISSFPEPTCIVQKALTDLTGSINLGTGINNPSDNSRAKTYIRALYKYHDELNADIVGAFLVKNLGWDTRHADQIKELINILNSGKFFHGGEKTGLQNYYKKWRAECNT